MRDVLATYEVHNNDNDAPCRLEIVSGPTSEQVSFVSREWVPRLLAAHERALLAFRTLPEEERSDAAWEIEKGRFGCQDYDWDWQRKSRDQSGTILVLQSGVEVEALVQTSLNETSRIKESYGQPIVYIEYVATAPWNRREIQPKPRFFGLGKLMIGVAVNISQNEGMDGRCGLHSLPQVEGFYTHLGMQDLGIDEKEGLKYFEFSSENAKKLVEA